MGLNPVLVTAEIDLTKQQWSNVELLSMGKWLMRDIFLGGPNHPIDEFDFQCCLKLIGTDSNWRRVFSQMSDLSPEWDALNLRWNDIETTFLSEVGSIDIELVSAPLTRQLMSHVLKQARLRISFENAVEDGPQKCLVGGR